MLTVTGRYERKWSRESADDNRIQIPMSQNPSDLVDLTRVKNARTILSQVSHLRAGHLRVATRDNNVKETSVEHLS